MKRTTGLSAWILLLIAFPAMTLAKSDLIQVRQDFSKDPGWENLNNRMEAIDPPTIRQDFGWSKTKHAGGATEGEIGGKITKSRTPAYYAAKIGPFGFNDKLSASGRIVLMPSDSFATQYIGFFNSSRQGFRPWSTLVFHLGKGGKGKEPMQIWIDYMNANWQAGAKPTQYRLSADGVPHTWEFSYDPEAEYPTIWPDEELQKIFDGEKQENEIDLLKKIQKLNPKITAEEFRRRLEKAETLGLVSHWEKGVHSIGKDRWWAQPGQKRKGLITLCIDNDQSKIARKYLMPGHRESSIILDRFGIFNQQTPIGDSEFYISELTLNGRKIDLSKDPEWEGKGNRMEFVEKNFPGQQSFGFSETNHAGNDPGEIGGFFTHAEAPIYAYYGDEVGELTLDDPISFSGNVTFLRGETDAGMSFGFFNLKEKVPIPKPAEGRTHTDGIFVRQSLMITISGPAHSGYYFSPWLCLLDKTRVRQQIIPVYPDSLKHRFSVSYDPKANKGIGSIEVTLDDKKSVLNLTAKQRASGATFDHFGLINSHCGGKIVEVYLDDLSYTARRASDYKPVFHKQAIKTVPYQH